MIYIHNCFRIKYAIIFCQMASTSNFQSEVGEFFSEIGGELPAKFGRRFSSFFCWGKSSEAFSTAKLHCKFHHQTSLRGSGLWRALQHFRRSLTMISVVRCYFSFWYSFIWFNLNQSFRESKKGGKGEVKRGKGVGEGTGPEGERGGDECREKDGRKRARNHTRKTLILVLL